jgi:hypothetical protein
MVDIVVEAVVVERRVENLTPPGLSFLKSTSSSYWHVLVCWRLQKAFR